MTAGARAGASVLAAFALIALSAPWLPLRDPAAQPDGLVLRTLPPLARVYRLRLAGGAEMWANELRPAAGGGFSVRRGEGWSEVAPERLAAGRETADRPLFVLGTDALGRDLLSRVAWGARTSLVAGLLAACVAVAIGGTVGLASGLAGGSADAFLMRLTDGALAVPRLFLLVLFAALFRPSVTTLVLVIGGTTWMAAARLVRGEALSIKERDFVAAARASGAGRLRLALRHVLPSAAPVLLIEGALRLGQSVLLEASLSFLGLGVPPPTPSWGTVIADGRDRLLDAWWIATWPGLAIAAVVIAATLVAEGGRRPLLGSRSAP